MSDFKQILSIDYDSFMEGKITPHSDGNYTSALKLLMDAAGATAATYNVSGTVVVPVNELLTNKSVFYYDYEVIPEMDVIDDIKVTVVCGGPFSVSYHIGDLQYDPSVMKEYIATCATYNKFIIRITLTEKPTIGVIIGISHRNFILNSDHRRTFHKSIVNTKTNSYYNGCCMPLIKSKK